MATTTKLYRHMSVSERRQVAERENYPLVLQEDRLKREFSEIIRCSGVPEDTEDEDQDEAFDC